MKRNYRVLGFIVLTFVVFNFQLLAAGSEQHLNNLLNFIKWGAGAIGTLLAACSIIFAGIGVFKKMSGDPEGDKQLRNALYAAIFSAISWAAFAMIITAGAEHGTAIQGVDKGFQ